MTANREGEQISQGGRVPKTPQTCFYVLPLWETSGFCNNCLMLVNEQVDKGYATDPKNDMRDHSSSYASDDIRSLITSPSHYAATLCHSFSTRCFKTLASQPVIHNCWEICLPIFFMDEGIRGKTGVQGETLH